MRVLLFSGHMVDRPDRKVPRLPAAHVPAARRAIVAELQKLAVGAADRAITSAASGGDLLFAQACLQRGVALEIYLPFGRERFLQTSVRPGGARWVPIFEDVLAHPQVTLHLPGPDERQDPDEEHAYARCNLAMLRRARQLADGAIELLCLWDGSAGDGPGGTEHMVREVRAHGGHVHWIDTRALSAG